MKKLKEGGFTLIELLVVIAIIGILAAIVLASLGTARSKGSDAKIQEQLNSLRNAAEVYMSKNNNYGSATTAAQDCVAGDMGIDNVSGMANIVAAANWPNLVQPLCVTNAVNGATAASAFAAWHVMNDGSYWCVDSTGASKYESFSFTPPTITSAACP